MSETVETQARMAKIETDIEHIKNMLRLNTASNSANTDHIEKVFREKENAARMYLALAEKPRSQAALVEELHMSQANVSKICNHLINSGLVKRVRSDNGLYEYTWGELEQTLGVSEIARRIVK